MKPRPSLTSERALDEATHRELTLPASMPEVGKAVLSLVALAARDGACDSEWMRLLLDTLGACGAEMKPVQGPNASASEGLSLPQMLHARALLADIDEPRSMRDIAQACGLAPSTFSRAFRASAGMTPRAWRLDARVTHAKRLLEQTRLTMTRIAGECGFGEQAHFNHIFSRVAQCSPGEWRRRHAREAA